MLTLACLVWVAVDEALRCSLDRLLRSIHYTKPTWQLQLVLTLDEDVLGSRCVCDSPGQVAAFWIVLICSAPKWQACTLTSTLSACWNKTCPLWYTASCVSGALASVPFSFVLLSCEPAEVPNEEFTSLSEHYSHLLRLVSRAWFNSVQACFVHWIYCYKSLKLIKLYVAS